MVNLSRAGHFSTGPTGNMADKVTEVDDDEVRSLYLAYSSEILNLIKCHAARSCSI